MDLEVKEEEGLRLDTTHIKPLEKQSTFAENS